MLNHFFLYLLSSQLVLLIVCRTIVAGLHMSLSRLIKIELRGGWVQSLDSSVVCVAGPGCGLRGLRFDPHTNNLIFY